ncbi:GntR family transcriptional regulator [Oceanotoga sp. DSM 15011]|uniref:GntR family transcriptional regulator n=1 Tax=Oceanotoga sp. DSM 15011 TaxID=2984951 RepID=UPI0021F4EE03|nr:GntR family transcriptional regulator [Oceanotoga sp. DSM 15011]UYO98818.1 GntR family transcriptional regulator [Oceanotoga sp. DSM 15011]
MWFYIDFNSNTPVYQQIKNKIKEQIINKKLNPDDQIPSIRENAKILDVNLNTVARAYRELVAEGVLEVMRGKGYKVKDLNQDDFQSKRIKEFEKIAHNCKNSGIPFKKLKNVLEDTFKDVNNNAD